jgi:hypothetical protein
VNIHKILPTTEVNSLLISSDGLNYFFDYVKNKTKETNSNTDNKTIVESMIGTKKYFDNPQSFFRMFTSIDRKPIVDWEEQRITDPSILSDDLTVIMIKRNDESSN